MPDATKTQLARVRKLRRASSRRDLGEFLADSPNAVREAIDGGADVVLILVTDDYQSRNPDLLVRACVDGVEAVRVDEATMSSAVSTKSQQGIAAVVAVPASGIERLLECETVAVLDAVQDPGNVGALLRSADCFGAGLLLGKGCADPFGPKVARSSAGALFRTPLARNVDLAPALERLKSNGFHVVGADPEAGATFDSFSYPEKCAVVLGNEGAGLDPEVDELLDARVAVPMQREGQSLNVAIAGSMILHAACARARREVQMAAVVSAISHDLRSPLTSVKGFAQTIEKRWESLDEELKKEMVGQISLAADRLLRAIGELVDTARLETGELRCIPIEFDPAPVVAGVLDEVSVEYADVEFEIAVEDSHGAIYADRERFSQAMRVLVENAAKHGDGRVRVATRPGKGWVDVDVADNGKLPRPEEVALILSGRVAGRKQGAAPSGTGLALHVVAGVATLQGGELLVSEASDGFETFTLRLPAGGVETGAEITGEVNSDR